MNKLQIIIISCFSRIAISFPALLLLILTVLPTLGVPTGQTESDPEFYFTISFPDNLKHSYHVDFKYSGFNQDTVEVKMPRWMPGYYQIMDYAKDVRNIAAADAHGNVIPVARKGDNGWLIASIPGNEIVISYDISTYRKFVATSYTDSSFAYILPENTFLYVEGLIKIPVTVRIESRKEWDRIATGLDAVEGTTDQYYAPDFDILYDCPILIGDLEALPSFEVDGIEHRFIACKPGSFNQDEFIGDLKKFIQVSGCRWYVRGGSL